MLLVTSNELCSTQPQHNIDCRPETKTNLKYVSLLLLLLLFWGGPWAMILSSCRIWLEPMWAFPLHLPLQPSTPLAVLNLKSFHFSSFNTVALCSMMILSNCFISWCREIVLLREIYLKYVIAQHKTEERWASCWIPEQSTVTAQARY
jgi:hypothetical protein